MTKNERKKALMEIIDMVDVTINTLKGSPADLIKEADHKLEELRDFFEDNCIMPREFDKEELLKEILCDYFQNDIDVANLMSRIIEFRAEVEEHVSEMRDGANKEEWEEFLGNFEDIEYSIDLERNDCYEVEEYFDALEELKENILSLI